MSTEDKTENIFPITDMGFVENAMLNDTINAVLGHIGFNSNEIGSHGMNIGVDGIKMLFVYSNYAFHQGEQSIYVGAISPRYFNVLPCHKHFEQFPS